MKLLNLKFAWQIVKRKPLKSIMTILQVALGIGAVVACINLDLQMSSALRAKYEGKPISVNVSLARPEEMHEDVSLVSPSGGKQGNFSIDDYNRVKEADIFPYCSLNISYYNTLLRTADKTYAIFFLYGGDVDLPYMAELKLLAGNFFSSTDIQSGRASILIEGSFARELFGSYEEAVGQSVNIDMRQPGYRMEPTKENTYTVAGVFGNPKDYMFSFQDYYAIVPYTHPPDQQKILSGHPFVIQLPAGTNIAEAQNELESLFMGLDGYFNLKHTTVALEDELAIVRNFSALYGSFAAIVLLVSSVSILSTNMVNIAERGMEIGLRRALGATKSNIIIQILLESAVYSFLGGLLGFIIGYYAQIIFFTGPNAIIGLPYPVKPNFTGPAVFTSLIITLFIGVVFGLYPAWQAANISPVEFLKDE